MQDLQVLSLRHQHALIATVALSFLLLLTSAVLVWQISRSAAEADRRVLLTLEVKRWIAQIHTSMIRAESSHRGFLVTGDTAFLATFRNAGNGDPASLATLRQLVADDPPQVTRVDELAAVIGRRIATMEATLRLTREGRTSEAALIVRDRGEPLMNQFREHIEALDRVEDQRLLRRQQSATDNRERFFQAVGVMLISCGMLALFTLVSVRRYVGALEASRVGLREQNRLLEQRVQERTRELEQTTEVAQRERGRAESLLTDVNHRVGNNLALVSSFLTMQLRAVRHPEAAKALDAARARVQAVASAHRKLRLGADFATVRANEVLAAVIEDIVAGLPPGDLIKIDYDVAALEIDARDAVSLGVLASELVMNAVKHAFGGEEGCVNVRLAQTDATVPFLEVSDDGVGWHGIPRHEGGSLGGRIIDMVARQFGGQPERAPVSDDARRPGTRIRIELIKLQLVPQLN